MPRGVLFAKTLLLTCSLLLSIPLPASDGVGNSAPSSGPVETVHGLSLYDSPELPADFAYFPHVNPLAPKGGTITHTAVGSSFDSTNPFIIRGTPVTGISQIYDTLMASNPNEPFSLYGLLAEGVRLDPHREWIEFDLRPEARFQDGEPVTAYDVVFSLNLLREEGNPFSGPLWRALTTHARLRYCQRRITLSLSQANGGRSDPARTSNLERSGAPGKLRRPLPP